MTLSVVIITYNEELNIGRTLKSVEPLTHDPGGEIIVVDSGSTDRTVEIARSMGARVFVEEWKGFAAQKNSAIEKATGDWILSLDADEEVSQGLAEEIARLFHSKIAVTHDEWCLTVSQRKIPEAKPVGFYIPRENYFLGRSIKHGGFWPDRKLRLFLRDSARFEDRPVHENLKLRSGKAQVLHGVLLHHAYPTLSSYIQHMNHYSSLGAEMAVEKTPRGFSLLNIVLRPAATFVYNYFLRLGFLDGREGLLLHLYHAGYVSWKYAKAWELSRSRSTSK